MSVYQSMTQPALVALLAIYAGGFAATTGLSVIALAKLFGQVSWSRPAWLLGSIERTMAVAIAIGVGTVIVDLGVRTVVAIR
ncbi:MAG: hypothetical protein ACFBSD_14435 [Paracoccaceae bacterium]